MSASQERDPMFRALAEMEDDVADVLRWGDVIRDLGTGDGEVSQNGLFAIGGVLRELGARLDARWKAAFISAGGIA